MASDGFCRVMRTGGIETALTTDQRTQRKLIKPHQCCKQLLTDGEIPLVLNRTVGMGGIVQLIALSD